MNVSEALKKYDITVRANNDFGKTVVFSDCMDTVIKRSISLWELLDKWSCQMGREFGINSATLKKYRYDTVKSAMHNTVSIEFIYDELFEQLHFYGLISKSEKRRFCERAHEIEIALELSSQSLINETVDFLLNEKKKGCKIYCISDFRLPAIDIMNFFEKLNINRIFDGCFASCDFGKTKKEGNFYSWVLNHLNVNASDCLMIGDNLKSDCINATLCGIKSCLIV